MKLSIITMICCNTWLTLSDPICLYGVPAPSMEICHKALDLMMKDIEKYPYIRYITRNARREGDYVLPKNYPSGGGRDRCVISIDVDPPNESDITSLHYLSAMALRIISFCIDPQRGIPGIGEDWLLPKKVILVKVSTTVDDDGFVVPLNLGETEVHNMSSIGII